MNLWLYNRGDGQAYPEILIFIVKSLSMGLVKEQLEKNGMKNMDINIIIDIIR